jgi:hypothetical protein
MPGRLETEDARLAGVEDNRAPSDVPMWLDANVPGREGERV